MYKIYCIENKFNHKKYVGQTKRTVHQRFLENTLPNTNPYLWKDVQLISRDGFDYFLLEETDRDNVDDRERYWIQKLNTIYPDGYNNSPVGQTGPRLTAKSKKLLSNAQTKRFSDQRECEKVSLRQKEHFKHTPGTFLGKHHTKETKKKLSQNHLGKITEYCKSISRKVYMCDLHGTVIRTFVSLSETGKWLKQNNYTQAKNPASRVKECCDGRQHTLYNHIFKYAEDVETIPIRK